MLYSVYGNTPDDGGGVGKVAEWCQQLDAKGVLPYLERQRQSPPVDRICQASNRTGSPVGTSAGLGQRRTKIECRVRGSKRCGDPPIAYLYTVLTLYALPPRSRRTKKQRCRSSSPKMIAQIIDPWALEQPRRGKAEVDDSDYWLRIGCSPSAPG